MKSGFWESSAGCAFRVGAATLLLSIVAGAQTDSRPPATLSKLPSAPGTDTPHIKYERFVLNNGLVVLLAEDHASPTVSVYLGYHVGSKDEPVGKRGLAHLFEHMMFSGSRHLAPGEHQSIIQSAGGSANARTENDATVFYSEMPSNMLETALWLEADRLAFLSERLDSVSFERERAAVFNEIGRANESKPAVALPAGSQVAPEAMANYLFPDPSPYHVSPFGVMSELRSTTLADLRSFFAKYYVPSNATLALVGDFKTGDARHMVEKYLGGIRRGAPIRHPVAENGPLGRETRIVLEDRVAPTRGLWVGWRGVAMSSTDRPAVVALMGVLNGGTSSILYRSLVSEGKVASALPPLPDNGLFDLESAGWLGIIISPSAQASLTDVERGLDSAIASVRDRGVTPDELRRWMSFHGVRSVTQLLSTRVRADQLQQGEMLYGNPIAKLMDIDQVRRVTPADVQRVARKYLGAGRVVLSVVPAGKTELRSRPDEPFTNVTPGRAP